MANETDKFFTLDRIPVTLTYLFTDPPTTITFPCKMALSADDEAARQAYYSQPTAEQEKGEHAYYVDLLARILVGPPTGLPGFDEFAVAGVALEAAEGDDAPKRPTIDTLSLETIADRLREYLGDASAMKKKIVADAITRYNRIAQPAEFFR